MNTVKLFAVAEHVVTNKPAATRRTAKSAVPRDGYHHGALREALIESSEALLAERGFEGFSLREVARRSGVSSAAPAHHFGDADGLLAAVATLAFDGLTAALEAGNLRGGTDPVVRLREQGVGYVDFALRYPGRFATMFRRGLRKVPALEHSAHTAFMTLECGVRDLYGLDSTVQLAPAHWHALMAVWSVVHGFANLTLAGQFQRFTPPGGQAALLREILGPLLDAQLRALTVPPIKVRAVSRARAPLRP